MNSNKRGIIKIIDDPKTFSLAKFSKIYPLNNFEKLKGH